MIVRIKDIKPLDDYILSVTFDDGKHLLYDLKTDIDTLPGYDILRTEPKLYENLMLDESRTCVYWSDEIDLPSDAIYEYGVQAI